VQCDCNVIQLYHDAFSDLSIVVSLDPIHRLVIKNVKHFVFDLSLMWFNRAIEILCKLFNPMCRVLS
jgi:hypothetical protein